MLPNRRLIALTTGLALLSASALAQVAVTNLDLPSFHQVNQSFSRGGQPTFGGIELLAKLGFKTIINLRAADEDSGAEEWRARETGLGYFNLPMKGRGGPPDAQMQAVLSLIDAAENQPVFLHCKRGKDRTGTVVACYRILHDHWTSEQAIAEARHLGLRWTEFGMKRYIRAFYRRQLQAHPGARRPGDFPERNKPAG